MAQIPLPFASYELDSLPASCSRLVNCYIEQLPPGAKTPARLVRAPGLKTFSNLGLNALAMLTNERFLYVAYVNLSGDFTIIAIDRNAVTAGGSSFGNYLSNSPFTTGAIGNNVAVFCTEPYVYQVSLSTPGSVSGFGNEVSGQITDTDFTDRGAAEVAFLDNYLLFREPNTGRFFGADFGSATSFDALNFATAESEPDLLTGIIADHGQLLAFGEWSSELWYNSGVQGFPFERVPNGRIEIGCKAGFSKAKVDQSVAWLASDGTVRILNGVTPVRISTHAIEKHLQGDLSGARGWSYKHNGHEFYVLHLPNKTFVYDAATQLWHERQTYGHLGWEVGEFVQAFGRTMCIAHRVSFGYDTISTMDDETYEDNGNPQVMSWTYQPIYAENRMASHHRLEVGLETGVGTNSVTDPKIMLEFSDDGGNTFTHFSTQSLGAKGRRETRVMWHGLGMSNNRVYRMSVSDPIKVAVTDTIIDAVGARL